MTLAQLDAQQAGHTAPQAYPQDITIIAWDEVNRTKEVHMGVLITENIAYAFTRPEDNYITVYIVKPSADDADSDGRPTYSMRHAFDFEAYDEDDHGAMAAMTKVLDHAATMSGAEFLLALAQAARGRRP